MAVARWSLIAALLVGCGGQQDYAVEYGDPTRTERLVECLDHLGIEYTIDERDAKRVWISLSRQELEARMGPISSVGAHPTRICPNSKP